MKINDINSLILQELKETSIDLSYDYVNMGINKIAESEIIKQIPIVKHIKLFYDMGSYFKQRKFIKNICIFLKEYNINSVEQKIRETFIKKLDNEKERDKIIDFVLVYLESIKQDEKVILFSKLFKMYVAGIVDWNTFCFLTDSLEKVFYKDLINLLPLYKLHKSKGSQAMLDVDGFKNISSFKRLESVGLIEPNYEIITMVGSSPMKVYYRLNEEGLIFSEIVSEIFSLENINIEA